MAPRPRAADAGVGGGGWRCRRLLRASSARTASLLAGAGPAPVRVARRRRGDRSLSGSPLRKGHYMPPALLDSQVATLEPPRPNEAVRIDAGGTPEETARAVVAALRPRSPASRHG